MSKKDIAIVEVVSNGFGELKEVAVISVDATTGEKTGMFYTRIANESNGYNGYTVKEAMDTVIKMVNGKKLAAHTGLDFEGPYLNKILNETHGFTNPISRGNIVDTHVLAMKYLKGVPKDMNSIAKHFNIAINDDKNALDKAYTTYGILKGLFVNKMVRQHTYKYAPNPVTFPEVKPTLVVEKVVTTVETTVVTTSKVVI